MLTAASPARSLTSDVLGVTVTICMAFEFIVIAVASSITDG